MDLFNFQTSLRQKITLGYFVVAVLILGISLFTFEQLRLVEEKILLGERITELFDTTLEIRRFERNYFLHKEIADYEENVAYVHKLHQLLDREKADFTILHAPEHISELQNELDVYGELMAEYVAASRQDPAKNALLEPRIRSVGKHIVSVAENMVSTERSLVQGTLTSFRKILVFSIIGVAFLIVAIGQALSRRVVQPLKQMEESVDAVSSGKRGQLTMSSRDREIVSVANAFNHMLRELEIRQKHLLRSEKLASMGTMLSGVAHELNNPLSNIWSSCQILLEELDEPNVDIEYQKTLLRQIDEQSVRARNIVRSLLDFARDKQFTRESVSLYTLVHQTLRFIKGEIPSKVAVTIDIPEDIVLLADKQRLQQAFLNLIKNAVEAVGEEGAVQIMAHPCQPETGPGQGSAFFTDCHIHENAVDVSISDTGHGIAPEILPRIFDPFYSTKDVGKGMGLGLFIVYQIVDEHDGCISVNSEVGKGTSFLIRLPLQETMVEAEAKPLGSQG